MVINLIGLLIAGDFNLFPVGHIDLIVAHAVALERSRLLSLQDQGDVGRQASQYFIFLRRCDIPWFRL